MARPRFALLLAVLSLAMPCRAGDEPDKAQAVGREAALYDVRAAAKSARDLFAYSILHYRFGFTNQQLAGPLAGFCVVFPLLAFRHARALWLAMDCRWDPGMMTDEED